MALGSTLGMVIRPGAADTVWRRDRERKTGMKREANIVGREHQELVERGREVGRRLYTSSLMTFDNANRSGNLAQCVCA